MDIRQAAANGSSSDGRVGTIWERMYSQEGITMKLSGQVWKPVEITRRCFDRSILAICLILQLLFWALLAIGAFCLHWTIGIAIVCWIVLAPVTLLMQIRPASRTEEQPHHLVAPSSSI